MDLSLAISMTRVGLVIFAGFQLAFEWWYLGAWYWLPKSSPKRLAGWGLLVVSSLVLPVVVYPNVAHGAHRDEISVAILFVHGIAMICTLFYRLKYGKPSEIIR